MKKFTLCVMTVFLLASFAPLQLSASTIAITTTASQPIPAANAARLAEIKAIDKSSLSAPERKELRHEKRSLKGHGSHINGGVYISAGAIIVVLLILLILL